MVGLFDFYPFTETTDGSRLIAKSVASLEIWNNVEEFSGQRAPHLPTADRLSFGADRLVLDACLKQWYRRFIGQKKEWKTRVLFRSLQIAAQASRMPAVGTGSPTIHDAGVGIALWVSAMEILSHPRKGNASLRPSSTCLPAQIGLPAIKNGQVQGKVQGFDHTSKLHPKVVCRIESRTQRFLARQPRESRQPLSG